jgi:chromosome segregation ATPase
MDVGNLAVDYPGLIAPLTQAIQEQQAQQEQFNKKVLVCEKTNVELQRKISSLESELETQKKLMRSLLERVERLERKH